MPPAATFRSALSSLRFQSLCRRAHPRGRDDLRVVRFNAVAGAPHFIYPALRHRASARAKALYGALIPRGRDDLRVVRLNAVAGAPHFIYPAPRLCASQGTLWRIFHAGGTTSVSMPATFRSALSFLRFPPRPLQCPHPNQLRVCAPPCETFSLNSTDPQQPARRDFCHGATEPRSEVNVVPRHLRRTFVRVSQVPHPHLTSV